MLVVQTCSVLGNHADTASLARTEKTGVPSPVTGSQPGVAFQLAYGTRGDGRPADDIPLQPVEPPCTISVKPVWLSP